MIESIAFATVLTCWAFSGQRLTVILPYAFVASQVTDWAAWGGLTLLLVAWAIYSEVVKGVRD